LIPLALTLSTKPLRVWWVVFHSSMASSSSSATLIARFGPSAMIFNSPSVMMVAISIIERVSISSPVISKSIQTIRSLFSPMSALLPRHSINTASDLSNTTCSGLCQSPSHAPS